MTLTPCSTTTPSQQWTYNTTTHQLTNAVVWDGLVCLDAGPMTWVNPCSLAPASAMAMCDPSLSFQERVSDLVGNLTMEEKAGLFPNFASAVPRLNIPVYQWWSEALHGGLTRICVTLWRGCRGCAMQWVRGGVCGRCMKTKAVPCVWGVLCPLV